MDTRLISRIARQGGGRLLNRAVDRLLPAKLPVAGRRFSVHSLTKSVAGAAVTRVATGSVPGAIIVGGGIIAKALYDQRKRRREEQARLPAPVEAPEGGDGPA